MKILLVRFHNVSSILCLLFQTFSKLILLQLQSKRRGINLWPCAGLFVARSGHQFQNSWWILRTFSVSSTCVFFHVFIVCLIVHRVAGCVRMCKTHLTGFNTCCDSSEWLKPLTTAATRLMVVSRTEESVQSGYINLKRFEADELGRFFVTGATDTAGKSSHFYCRIFRKDVSVPTHGPHEILRCFQDSKHFPRDQHLRLETPGWRVLNYEGNPMTDEGKKPQWEWTLRAA